MSYTSGFFNSVNGDRLYNAEDMSMYFEGLVTDGVYSGVGDALAVTVSSVDFQIAVKTGRALIDCHWLKNSTPTYLTIDINTTTSKRTDLVVVKLDKSTSKRTMSLEVLRNQNIPLTNSDDVKYLVLARITVPASSGVPTQANIEDLRGTDNCLYVHGLIDQIDTTTCFQQYDAAFRAWFNTLASALVVDNFITTYRSTLELESDYEAGTQILISIEQYNSATDVFQVYMNGHLLSEDKYTLDKKNNTFALKFDFPHQNNKLEMVVFKSQIGSSGSLDNRTYHVTTSGSRFMTINHNLGKFPAVTCVASNGDTIVPDTTYNSLNQVYLQFSETFAGTVYLN